MLKDWFRSRRFAGSRDRAAITERVFTVLRRTRPLAHRMNSDESRAIVLASLLEDGMDLAAIEKLFDGAGYGPAPLSDGERSQIAATPEAAPPHVEGDFPQFLEGELTAVYGDTLQDEMKAMQQRASIDLRVNLHKTSRDRLIQALRDLKYIVHRTPYSPIGLRLEPGPGAGGLSRDPLFESGMFEFQDESAQICAILCDARQGMRVLDLSAGAGGKALALSAFMHNKGEIVASDVRPAPLRELILRADRAGDKIISSQTITGTPPKGPFDLVLVDAPCSGSGTWRRQPELKLRFTPQRLEELTKLQDQLLDQAAARTRPGGRLVYATCSILPSENEARIESFLARNSEFTIIPARDVWVGSPPPGLDIMFRASPFKTGTDGFFTALLLRKGVSG